MSASRPVAECHGCLHTAVADLCSVSNVCHQLLWGHVCWCKHCAPRRLLVPGLSSSRVQLLQLSRVVSLGSCHLLHGLFHCFQSAAHSARFASELFQPASRPAGCGPTSDPCCPKQFPLLSCKLPLLS